MPSLFRLASTESNEIGILSNVFIVFWRDALGSAGLAAMRRELPKFAGLWPQGIGFLAVIEAGHGQPPPAERQELVALVGGVKNIRAHAVVLEDTGLEGMSVRTTINLMGVFLSVIRRDRGPLSMFPRSIDAATWLVRHLQSSGALPERLTALELAAAADRLRVPGA